MKAENKSWADIAAELSRPPHELKKRFKEISSDNVGQKHDGGKKDKKGKNESGGGEEKEKQQQKQSKKDKKAAKKEAEADEDSEVRFTMGEWLTLQEDSLFSFGELQLLSELIIRDRDQTWLRIAGAFFDKTGRRVHQDDIREKFEEMATMG